MLGEIGKGVVLGAIGVAQLSTFDDFPREMGGPSIHFLLGDCLPELFLRSLVPYPVHYSLMSYVLVHTVMHTS